MAKTRGKTQPEQDGALFKERKPRKKREPITVPAQVGDTSPPASEGTPYVMPAHRAKAVEDWLNSVEVDDGGNERLCSLCQVPVFIRDGTKLDKAGKPAHKECVDAQPVFTFPPLVKKFHEHEELWLDRGYDMFKAGYYVRKLYQCGPGNIYGQFGSFGLDERDAIEDLGIELIQIWTKTVAYQITMADFKAKGSIQQTPPGPRWLVDLAHFEKAKR